jgi:hypothetical protein
MKLVFKFLKFDVTVCDHTGMISANDLMNAYKLESPLTTKSITRYLDNTSTKQFIDGLMFQNDIPVNLVVSTKRGKGGGTWMHPFLFVDFAMWLSSEFKLEALKMVHEVVGKSWGSSAELLEAIKSALSPKTPTTYAKEVKLIESLAKVGTSGEIYTGDDLAYRISMLEKHDVKLLKSGKVLLEERMAALKTLSELM